jgi:hypothetical protein
VRGLLIWFLIILGAIFAFVLGVLFYKKRQAKKESLKRSDQASKGAILFLATKKKQKFHRSNFGFSIQSKQKRQKKLDSVCSRIN